jgi:hypothetical protein
MIAVASYDPTINITEHILDTPRAKLRFYYRNAISLTAPFSLFYDLDDIDHEFDPTGDIGYLFAVAKVPPKMKFYDFDGDGDLDFAFTNGQLYLARNMQMEDGGLPTTPIRFLLVRDYFSDVNAKLTSGGWGQPDTYDLNGDEVWDLTLNYAHKNGTTAFINKGTNLNPVWEEDKRIFWNWDYEGEDITNIKLLNLTDTRILPVKRSSLDVYADFFDFEMNQDFVMVPFNHFWRSRSRWKR